MNVQAHLPMDNATFLDWVQEDYDEVSLRRDFHANGLASFINDWVLAHE